MLDEKTFEEYKKYLQVRHGSNNIGDLLGWDQLYTYADHFRMGNREMVDELLDDCPRIIIHTKKDIPND